jgi:hypothetical protein
MLFITYWELDEAMSETEKMEATSKLSQVGPPEGINLLRWDGTPDNWGIIIFEAEKTVDIIKNLALWRTKAGFFKYVKTAPLIPVEELMPQLTEYLQSLPQQ